MKKEADKDYEHCAVCGKNSVFRWYRVTPAHLPQENLWICNACAQVEEDIQIRHSVSIHRRGKVNE